jgi:outer membrane protein assembly factor BamB
MGAFGPTWRSRRGRSVLLVLLVVVAAGCDWPMFRYGPEQTGANPLESTISVANVANLHQVATFMTGDTVESSPAVVNNVLYVGSDDNRVYAFDAKTKTGCSGTPRVCAALWRSSSLGGNVISSPAVAGGRVFVASQGDRIQALDATGTTGCSGTPKTCSPLWVKPLLNDPIASPTVANGLVYVEQTEATATVFALDAATGAHNWDSVPEEKSTGFIKQFGAVAVANGVAYATLADIVSSDGEGLYAFDATGNTNCSGTPKRCAPLWRANFDYFRENGTSPAVAGGVVYVVDNDGVLRAYDAGGVAGCSGTPKVCSPLWTANAGQGNHAPAVANGRVYVASSGTVKAFDAAGTQNCSGSPKVCTPLWTSPALGTISRSSPIVANGVLFIGSSTGVHGLDAANGGPPLWNSAGGYRNSTPAVVNGRLYIGSAAFALP